MVPALHPNWVRTRTASDRLLWRYLCDRHGTPPDPSPNQHFGSLLGLVVGSVSNGPGSTLLGGLAGFLIMLALYYFGVLFHACGNRLGARGQEADDEEALGGM